MYVPSSHSSFIGKYKTLDGFHRIVSLLIKYVVLIVRLLENTKFLMAFKE